MENLEEDPEERRHVTTGRRDSDKYTIWDRRLRDAGIYLIALAGAANQLFFVKNPSETILLFLAAMLGFPLVLRADEFRRSANDETKRISNNGSKAKASTGDGL